VNAADAATVTQRRYEIIVSPRADSGFRVRRNVRADEGAEGRLQRDAARKRLASRLGMTRRAIGGSRKISSALYGTEGLQVDPAGSARCKQ
jgi:hypothetical protein